MMIGGRQLFALSLLILLPLCVAALTAMGLWRLDLSLRGVSEEYDELRALQLIDRDLSAAALALASDDPKLTLSAKDYLKSSEAALVHYLATQFDDVAGAEHQAVESSRASDILRQLQELRSEDGSKADPGAQSAQVIRIRDDLNALHLAADSEVTSALRTAGVARRSTLWWVIAASLCSTAACILIIASSLRAVNRRLRDLHQKLASRTPGEPAKTPKDIGSVVTQIEELNSRMIEDLEESGRELLRRERMVGIGLLAADVAHEINNPMNAMLGLSELGLRTVQQGPVDEAARGELQESLHVMRREALRCKAIVERLMAMVRSDRKPGWFDATRLIHESVQVAQAARPDRASCFVVTGDKLSVRGFGPANDVRQILLTLLINAADAVRPDGRIEVDATTVEREVWLRVRDNGRGFTEEMRRNFFTPFRSYREGGEGTGLGLSIAQALAEGMGASLRAFSEGPGLGSMFVLAIPVPEDAA
jgi:signal transduction histidine kinase